MHPNLKQIVDKITTEHPNLVRPLFLNIKSHLPFGLGEGKVKEVLADNIPGWIYGLSETELKEFIVALQRDPEFYRYLRFQITILEKILNEE